MTEKRKKLVVKCPICKKENEWKNNPYRPFCSERCRLTDLGSWADGSYSLDSVNPPDFEETN